MPTSEELVNFLRFPRESLNVECKSWLDLSKPPGKATLAKAAIALANHGGGMIVLGMRENTKEGGALGSQARPDGLSRYNQDEVNAAINRYADPKFHCELSFEKHPDTGNEHAFISVPGGTVPVMSKSSSEEGVIAARRCYMRKPGPQSEEPNTAEEWRQLLDRCVRARREDMLDAIRAIVQGHAGTAPSEEARNRLNEFVSNAQQRWQELIEIKPLPPDDSARMAFGHYELAFEILDVPPAPSLGDLRRRLDEAGQIRYSGCGPFFSLHREPFQTYPCGELIETWLGAPDKDKISGTPAYCDFWRAHPNGRLFLQCGYDEDGSSLAGPGTCIDITLPIWRVGEAMLYIARLARSFDDNPAIIVRGHYIGLQGRVLTSIDRRRVMFGNHVCNDQEATIETQATAREIDENLAEVLHPMLVPFYERFSFFELSMPIVAEEIAKMRQGRY